MIQARHNCGLGEVVAIEIPSLQNLLNLCICPCSQFRLNIVFINDIVHILGMIFYSSTKKQNILFYISEFQFQASILLKVGNVISVTLGGLSQKCMLRSCTR